MIHVYLDDIRPCPRGFVYAKNAEECLLLLQECEVDVLSLDFDLGLGQANGLELVQRMAELGLYPRTIYLHSSSSMGRLSMYERLRRSKPEHVAVYNHPVPAELLEQIRQNAG